MFFRYSCGIFLLLCCVSQALPQKYEEVLQKTIATLAGRPHREQNCRKYGEYLRAETDPYMKLAWVESLARRYQPGRMYSRTDWFLSVRGSRLRPYGSRSLGRHTQMEFYSVNFSLVMIRAHATNRFICMDSKGKLYTREIPDENCLFMERPVLESYYTYASCAQIIRATGENSEQHVSEGERQRWHVAISRKGHMRSGKRTRRSQKSAQFILAPLSSPEEEQSVERRIRERQRRLLNAGYDFRNLRLDQRMNHLRRVAAEHAARHEQPTSPSPMELHRSNVMRTYQKKYKGIFDDWNRIHGRPVKKQDSRRRRKHRGRGNPILPSHKATYRVVGSSRGREFSRRSNTLYQFVSHRT